MECPECRLRTTNRTYCTRCNERLVPAAHLPPHRFPSTPVDYAGFGARFSAGLIDVVVLLPLLALTTWIETRSPASAALGAVLSIFLFGGYQVGLVALRGQTVGKRVMDIQVRRADGSAVGFGEAFMRYLPFLVQLVVGSLGQIVAASALTQADFDLAGGLMGRSGMLSGAGPGWAVAVNTLMTFFVLADVIVFFANRRHRALHDVIAGTVVVHV
ncbi:RDD family protein [Longimicrobium sp.]|uniref:RDD family protein n=1 Tax=Longimicrobium sp. TaxID=2029185 RepID=UPI002C0E78C2|nr:RDD family protein [Longimicrobium sp.]HSU17523.1 RDD family protein [Longimicrobium sp.]